MGDVFMTQGPFLILLSRQDVCCIPLILPTPSHTPCSIRLLCPRYTLCSYLMPSVEAAGRFAASLKPPAGKGLAGEPLTPEPKAACDLCGPSKGFLLVNSGMGPKSPGSPRSHRLVSTNEQLLEQEEEEEQFRRMSMTKRGSVEYDACDPYQQDGGYTWLHMAVPRDLSLASQVHAFWGLA